MSSYIIKPLFAQSQRDGEVRVLSLSLANPYCADSLDFHDRAEVETFMQELKAEAEKLWPGRLL